MRFLIIAALAAGLSAGSGAQAQDTETLADIRQDLTVLWTEVQRLKRELSTTGGAGNVAGGEDLLDRVVAIEGELTRLTAKTEDLTFRVDRVVSDGTNRIGDLEFRLCELEPNCDIASLSDTPTLGGGDTAAAPTPQPQPPAETGDGPALAVGEEADFRRAEEALASGDFRGAADQLATFRAAYPGSPLEPQALLMLGKALEGVEDLKGAARAFLDGFSGYPEAPTAAESLLRLGLALDGLGQRDAACQMLVQVGDRYPGTPEATDAAEAAGALGCS